MPTPFEPNQPLPLQLTVPQAAYLLGYSVSYVYTMLYKGELPFIKHGRTRRVALEDVQAWIAAHKQTAA